MSSKKASNDPGLCPLSYLCSRARARNQFSSLSLSTTRTTPHCQILVIPPAFYLTVDILLRDPKGRVGVVSRLRGGQSRV
jgi:hypothetical protein